MKSVIFLPILFGLILFNPVYSKKCIMGDVCDFDDNVCVKRGAANFYRQVIDGVPCVVNSSDPLFKRDIPGKIRGVEYTLSNVTMTGLKQCYITKARLKKVGLNYEYALRCPKLVLNYSYIAIGELGPLVLNERDDYIIIFKGTYGLFSLQKDRKCHFFSKTNYIETDAKGKITVDATTINEDKTVLEQTVAYLNKNPQILRDYLKYPVMPDLINVVFMNNLGPYLESLTVEEVFPKSMC